MLAAPPRLSALARLLAVATAAASGLVLLACGGSRAPARAAAAERAAEQQTETRFEDFARCLREHGVDAEAQSRPGGGHGLKVSGANPAAMQAAEKACARYRPERQSGPSRFSPQEKVELDERLERFAKCMREHGVEVEASVAGGQPHINVHATRGGGGPPQPESPAFQAAQKACSKLLPGGGPGAGATKGAGAAGSVKAGGSA